MTTVPSADQEAVVSTVLQDASFESDYSRFSHTRKWVIVGIAAYLSFLGPFSATATLPAVPNISADLHTTETNINYSNAVFFCAMAISPCIFAPLSQVWQSCFTLIEALRSSVRIHYH